jgi:4-amino-4-deoxy-L-arabinose transferase-like glycosyltransferase
LAGTWIVPLIDRDEPRFAEASREMIERNDYVIPYFNNQYRFDKPPLTYWAQVASYKIFGQNDFAARFPSAIAAALTALVIFAWGKRISDNLAADIHSRQSRGRRYVARSFHHLGAPGGL